MSTETYTRLENSCHIHFTFVRKSLYGSKPVSTGIWF